MPRIAYAMLFAGCVALGLAGALYVLAWLIVRVFAFSWLPR